MADYKILSLDGGGSWALIEARALGVLFGDQTPGRSILSRFDLVAANSGGSLVLGMLVADMTPAAIADLFLSQDTREEIFVKKWYAAASRAVGIGARYSTAAKLEGIKDVLDRAGSKLIDSRTRLDQLSRAAEKLPDLLIASFDYDRQRAKYFRSNVNSIASSDPGAETPPTLAEAMHASSTAPVAYFDEPAQFESPQWAGRRFWDGGTAGLNNPVLAAVTEAIANHVPTSDISVLSIGTGATLLPLAIGGLEPPLAMKADSPGLLTDLRKLAKTILDDPPDAATYIAHQILNGPRAAGVASRVVRLNPMIQPIGVPPDCHCPPNFDETEFQALVALEMDAVAQDEVDLIARFCQAWLSDAVLNQAIQANDQLGVHIGYSKFSEAHRQATALGLC